MFPSHEMPLPAPQPHVQFIHSTPSSSLPSLSSTPIRTSLSFENMASKSAWSSPTEDYVWVMPNAAPLYEWESGSPSPGMVLESAGVLPTLVVQRMAARGLLEEHEQESQSMYLSAMECFQPHEMDVQNDNTMHTKLQNESLFEWLIRLLDKLKCFVLHCLQLLFA